MPADRLSFVTMMHGTTRKQRFQTGRLTLDRQGCASLKNGRLPVPPNELDLVFPNQSGNPINTDCKLQNPIKKGLTAIDICKPLIFVVGTIGFEPTTSTVSR